ncbi:MAG TPA: type II toxin-antitoxin system HicB family antitoxin [Rhodothermales bacterium]|nr:type II toxin-antitoxin system HicB family antitoxin [Rhodothermales bacterium]
MRSFTQPSLQNFSVERYEPLRSGICHQYQRNSVMRNEFTAVIEREGDWHIAYSPEVPGANGQGRTKEEAVENLKEAIALILEDRREDGLRGVPADAVRETVVLG